MSNLSAHLYKTTKTVHQACKELGIQFNQEDLEDLEQCVSCNTWRYSYELDAETGFCSYCEYTYG